MRLWLKLVGVECIKSQSLLICLYNVVNPIRVDFVFFDVLFLAYEIVFCIVHVKFEKLGELVLFHKILNVIFRYWLAAFICASDDHAGSFLVRFHYILS